MKSRSDVFHRNIIHNITIVNVLRAGKYIVKLLLVCGLKTTGKRNEQ
jgi:hypothetical protein